MKVLVTGSTGYIGSRLVAALVEEGHQVTAGLRSVEKAKDFSWSAEVTAVRLDVSQEETVLEATAGCDVAIYLVHSMTGNDFLVKDREAATTFARACEANKVGKIIYLSGVIPDEHDLSDHLKSRLEVERIFTKSTVPTITLRAAIIIGSGSTSFELLRSLVSRLPLIPIPRWMDQRVQPVAASDVVRVLCAAVRCKPTDTYFDLGGPDVLSYAGLLALYADCAGLKRRQFPLPFIPTWAVGELSALIARMPRGTVTSIVESLHAPMVAIKTDYANILGFGPDELLGAREAIMRALEPVGDGAERKGEPLHGAPTDPDWAGP